MTIQWQWLNQNFFGVFTFLEEELFVNFKLNNKINIKMSLDLMYEVGNLLSNRTKTFRRLHPPSLWI